MSGFSYNARNARVLYRAILWAAGKESLADEYMTDGENFECAYYPNTKTLVVINNSTEAGTVTVKTPDGGVTAELAGEGIAIL